MTMTKTRAISAQRHRKILDWSDERGNGDPIMVTLIHGFAFYDNDCDDAACHVRGFENVKAALKGVREAGPCACNRCAKRGSHDRE